MLSTPVGKSERVTIHNVMNVNIFNATNGQDLIRFRTVSDPRKWETFAYAYFAALLGYILHRVEFIPEYTFLFPEWKINSFFVKNTRA